MTDTFEQIALLDEKHDPKTGWLKDTPKGWMEQTTWIMEEMVNALKQAKRCGAVGGNPDLTDEERRKSWLDRADYLRSKAVLCVNNTFDNIEKQLQIEENDEK